MNFRPRHVIPTALLVLTGAVWAPASRAGVSVSIVGDSAIAHISLTDLAMHTYDADVTIDFDTPSNLTVPNLNLTAELVDPNDPVLKARLLQPLLQCDWLPLSQLLCTALIGPLLSIGTVDIDPNFPMLITVEPPDNLWLFHGDFEAGSTADGNLHFRNAYTFELHAIGPLYTTGTTYRLYKAPLNGQFVDQTSETQNGSVRARGRSGGFSQFVLARDSRSTLIISLQKTLNLELRTLGSGLNATLQGDLLGLLGDVVSLLLTPLSPNYNAAIAKVDGLLPKIRCRTRSGIALSICRMAGQSSAPTAT
jgi:hypothetical protein